MLDTPVIAFHGDMPPLINGAKLLKKDMRSPDYVTHYFKGHDTIEALEYCEQFQSVYLFGYSRGGEVIEKLSRHIADRIVGATIYESRVTGQPGGTFPVLQLWNEGKHRIIWRRRHRWRVARESCRAWRRGRKYEKVILPNSLLHIKFPFGHGFDLIANSLIARHRLECSLLRQSELANVRSQQVSKVTA